MKIGLTIFPVHTRWLLPVAECADRLGYESLWVPEHLVFPVEVASKYPYDPSLPPPLPSTPLFDPLITLAMIGARTRQIKLGTGIYILPLRHPVVTAKLMATLDVLTEGRVLMGVGAGWLREEFDVVSAPWAHRGSRMEEILGIMRRLWSEERISHQGRFYQFDEIGFEPKPVDGSVPLLLGGESDTALNRAARFGDGWFGMYHTPESAAARVSNLQALSEAGKKLEISIGQDRLPGLDDIRRFRDVGVDRLVITSRRLWPGAKKSEEMVEGLERYADEVLSRLDD